MLKGCCGVCVCIYRYKNDLYLLFLYNILYIYGVTIIVIIVFLSTVKIAFCIVVAIF